MNNFTLRRTKSKLYILTFSKKYFERLKNIHPYAASLLISSLIKFNANHGKNIIINLDQFQILNDKLLEYEKTKPPTSLSQHYLTTFFQDGFRLLTIDIDTAPETLNEIYNIILAKNILTK